MPLSLGALLVRIGPKAAQRAQCALGQVIHGWESDLVTRLIPLEEAVKRRPNRRSVIEDCYSWLKRGKMPAVVSLFEDVAKLDIGNCSSRTPYYAKGVETLASNLSQFWAPHWHRVNTKSADEADKALVNLFGNATVNAATLREAYDKMQPGCSLGYPFFSNKEEFRPQVFVAAERLLNSLSEEEAESHPCMIAIRTSSAGEGKEPKQRVVWNFSHIITLLESMLQIAMLRTLKTHPTFAAWVHWTVVNGVVSEVLYTGRKILSVDFKSFDSSVSRELLRRIFKVIRTRFSEKDRALFDFVAHSFMNCAIITPDGILTDREGGVPSGSALTNLIDCLVQYWAFAYAASVLKVNVLRHITQGDDGVICFSNDSWHIDDVYDVLSRDLGLFISPKKTSVSSSAVYFLQMLHTLDHKVYGAFPGIRLAGRALTGMLGFESKNDPELWNPYMDTIRWLQQLETMRFHPCFPQMCHWLYTKDKILQNHNIQGIITLAGGVEHVQRVLRRSWHEGKVSLEDIATSAAVRTMTRFRVARDFPI